MIRLFLVKSFRFAAEMFIIFCANLIKNIVNSEFFCRFFCFNRQMRRLWRKIHQNTPDIVQESTMAITNQYLVVSMPLSRFIPNKLETSVGTIRMIDTEVRVRITVFMLLLMMLE